MEVLPPHEWVGITFTSPRLTRRVSVTVDSTDTVHVWALPGEEFSQFSAGGSFDYYEKWTLLRGTITFTPDRAKDWILVLENRHGHEIHVHYDVIW